MLRCVITEVPFSLSVRSSCCSCSSILPQLLFCTLLKTGRLISDVHNLPQNMRTDITFQSAVFCIVQYSSLLLCGKQFFVHITPSHRHIVPYRVHTLCRIVNQCNIFHFHHSASVENANLIFPQFFSFRQLDIPVSQNHIFFGIQLLHTSQRRFHLEGWFMSHSMGIFTEKHFLVLTLCRPSGTFRLGMSRIIFLKFF